MRNLEKCPECLQRFHVEWQGKSSQKGISLILNRLFIVLFILFYIYLLLYIKLKKKIELVEFSRTKK
jgi:preprotein translocase subunit SecG